MFLKEKYKKEKPTNTKMEQENLVKFNQEIKIKQNYCQ